MEQIAEVAGRLTKARLEASPIVQLSASGLKLSRHQAYEVQEKGIEHRRNSGQKAIAFKMGLTSRAKREQMNLDSPLYGELTDEMQIPSGGIFDLQRAIHPKVEPEVAFFIARDLKGPVDRKQVLDACEAVASALEILDSRYEQFKYFSMEDVISDNSSSSHFVLGKRCTSFSSFDLANLEVSMEVDGKVAQRANTSAISGDPVQSVVELCALLAQRKRILPGGHVVLAGAATAAVSLRPKMAINLNLEHLESVSFSVS